MATPAIPANFIIQSANSQILLSWDLAAGATSYNVYRSTDGTTFTNVANPTTPYYLDATPTLGTLYYYYITATGTSGVSAPTTTLTQVPVNTGEMCLVQLRLAAQQRADRVNSQFVTTPEWNSYINQSLFELYDLLVDQYGEDYFIAPPVTFNTNGTTQLYPLPDGNTFFTAADGSPVKAPAFYKLTGVDLGVNTGPNGYVTLSKFNFIDRNRYFYPNTASTQYGVFNMSYRLVGDKMEFIPVPSNNQPIRLWYIPRMTQLLKDTDITTQGVSGWLEYVIVDAAIKALQKEESDVTILAAQKDMLKRRIEAASMNRDAGQPDTISATRSVAAGGTDWSSNGSFKGGW